MIELKEEYQIFTFLSGNIDTKANLNVVINCENAVYGRLLSVCSKVLSKFTNYKVYLVNINKIIFKKDFIHYSSKIKRIIDAGDKHKGPFVPTIDAKYIRYRFRNMVNKNKRFDIVKRLITWELPLQTDYEFKITEKWVFKGFVLQDLMNKIKS